MQSLRRRLRRLAGRRYGRRILWETAIQLVARDFLREGDVAFDVGANVGGLAIAFSRLVGERGAVHAFEANPQLIPLLRADLRANNVHNATVLNNAVWSRSDLSLPLYLDPSYYASASTTLGPHQGWRPIEIGTISLDDYVVRTHSVPHLLKLDVEGSEYEVLRGAARLIEEHSPVVVFEYFPAASAETDSAEFLHARGYALFDANLYRRVSRDTYLKEFDPKPTVNLLAVPPALLETSGYADVRVETLFFVDPRNDSVTQAFELPLAGRYRIDVELAGADSVVAGLRLVRNRGEVLVHYEAPMSQLREHPSSSLVVDTPRRVSVRCEIKARGRARARLVRASVFRVVFSGRTQR